MTPKTESLLAEALELDTDERARLATELIASLDGDPDMNWEEAWTAELDARVRAAKRAGDPGSDWQAARKRILAALGT